jgi:hypothetical protein
MWIEWYGPFNVHDRSYFIGIFGSVGGLVGLMLPQELLQLRFCVLEWLYVLWALYNVLFYPGFNFIVFVFKISFDVVYLHTIWTFTLMGRSNVAILGNL